MIKKDNLHALRDFLGFGTNFIHTLQNYNIDKEKNSLLKEMNDWLCSCPDSANICYLDITIFDDQKLADKAKTILFATSKKNLHTYKTILHSFTNDGYAIAAHPSFYSGLQDVTEDKTPHLLYHQFKTKKKNKIYYIKRTNFSISVVNPYLKDSYSDGYKKNQQKSIQEQWEKLKAIFGKAVENEELLSCEAYSLKHMLAIPLGLKNSDGNFDLSACIFLGVDSSANLKTVQDIARHIVLSLVELYALPRTYKVGFNKGEDEGIEETIDVFAHQVRTLAGKVSSGWLVDNAIWNHPEFAKPRELPTPKITPLPELYEAVGTVLTLWSMSIEPDHLFPPGARTQFAYPPWNIHDIVNYAMYHARQSWIVGKCESIRLSDTKGIQSACDVVLGQKKDRIDFKSIKKECQINLGLFKKSKSNQLYIDKNDDKSIERYSELSGLIRLLVVHFENFLQNNDNGNIEVWVDYVQENETGTLEIYLKNLWNKDAQPNISKASHAGARSDKVLKFIENRFLKNQKVVITKPGQKAEYYCTKISISNLSWLEVIQ